MFGAVAMGCEMKFDLKFTRRVVALGREAMLFGDAVCSVTKGFGARSPRLKQLQDERNEASPVEPTRLARN